MDEDIRQGRKGSARIPLSTRLASRTAYAQTSKVSWHASLKLRWALPSLAARGVKNEVATNLITTITHVDNIKASGQSPQCNVRAVLSL